MSGAPIEEVLAQHRDSLMAIPGVVGVGQGLCNTQPCIKVFLAEENSHTRRRIPRDLGGYVVVVEVTGPFQRRVPNE